MVYKESNQSNTHGVLREDTNRIGRVFFNALKEAKWLE